MRGKSLAMLEARDDSLEETISPVYNDSCHGQNFLNRLHDLYLTQTLCDVILCVEHKEIHAHRMVLAANSPYFEGRC